MPRKVDVTDLPPLFCRPRRSPKLNPDSRHPSLLHGLGAGSRRQSAVPRATLQDMSDSALQPGNCSGSPLQNRPLIASRKLERSPLYLTENSSKTTLDNMAMVREEADSRAANIKLALDDLFCNNSNRPVLLSENGLSSNQPTATKIRNARILSTIAASSSNTSNHPHQHCYRRVVPHCRTLVMRESRSLDPFPVDLLAGSRKLDSAQLLLGWKLLPKKTSFRSLENCDKCTIRRGSKASSRVSEKPFNNNYPNGNMILVGPTQQLNLRHEKGLGDGTATPNTPLLFGDSLDPPISPSHLSEQISTTNLPHMLVKRWHSLDQVLLPGVNTNEISDCVPFGAFVDKKTSAKQSLRSWLVNLFNGNGMRTGDATLRRAVIPAYDAQSDRESIV